MHIEYYGEGGGKEGGVVVNAWMGFCVVVPCARKLMVGRHYPVTPPPGGTLFVLWEMEFNAVDILRGRPSAFMGWWVCVICLWRIPDRYDSKFGVDESGEGGDYGG